MHKLAHDKPRFPTISFQLAPMYLQLVNFGTSETSEKFLGEAVVDGLTLASLVIFPSLDGLEGS